ncbi:MAG: S1 RNA-binding domain-containing protein [Lachnospiraceae bacterium]|nr:S1 RNA-binding domain-containing protein [Lachnospiraceae bacterium]
MLFGQKQTLVIVKKVEFGVYLATSMEDRENRVLLPGKQVPAGANVGDEIEVFLYKDSQDRPIATTNTPKLTLGETARLKVVSVGKVGAFLDWGLEKDLFLPFREQIVKVKEGDEVIVALYLDKSSRLCATMRIYPYLSTESPYQAEDEVTGTIYEISQNFGAFVAVDDKYSALIAKKELYGELKVLQQVSARVIKVKEDGKLDLSIRQKAHIQMDTDAQALLELLAQNGGKLPIGDKSTPDKIRKWTGMSKNEFKRAAGRLYKERKVMVEAEQIFAVR